MRRVGFLACPGTLPGSSDRRADAHEHDLQVAALREGFAPAGLELVEIDWRAPESAFDGIELVLLGTVWDYQDHAERFFATIEGLAARGIAVCNPPELVRWNIEKTYLRDLEQAGAPVIPTLWLDDPNGADIAAAFDYFGCDRLVVKRQVGAGAEGQMSFDRTAPPSPDWRYGHRAMVQPFLPAIVEEGEYSFVFFDGEFSHCIRKTAAPGEYRIQSLYGGKEEAIDPPAEDIASAQAVVRAIPGDTPLYARIDMIRQDGALAVMEAELIEPYLYPEQATGFGARMAEAILKRI
ncbi:RimK family alpha-L-glutamate ligase [Erythrobacter sp. HKB08]|uniref:ATP-grasp domain-containing protein n=1 Tax=Erythrobacter sp. HKB08 TaxID=2502843 RepID=UPI001008A832|nr:hypothetical protein [Erythrobacter sp. HKB08]